MQTQKQCHKWHKKWKAKGKTVSLFMATMVVTMFRAKAQISVGLSSATTQVKGAQAYVGPLILAIGGLIGLAGGIRIYIKWNNGDNDVQKELIGWAGACVFLLLVGTLITAFFG